MLLGINMHRSGSDGAPRQHAPGEVCLLHQTILTSRSPGGRGDLVPVANVWDGARVRKVRAEGTRRKEGQGGCGRELTGDRGGGQRGRGEQQQPQGSSEGRGEGTVELGRNRGEVHRQGRREDIDGCRAGAGTVGAGFSAGGGGGSCVEQRDRNAAMRGTTRDGARGSRSEDQRDFYSTASLLRRLVTAAASSYSTPRRRSVTYVSRSRSSAPKAFLATAFLTLGRRRHVVLRGYTLEQHVIRGLGKGRLCMGMAHMVLHLIKNPEV